MSAAIQVKRPAGSLLTCVNAKTEKGQELGYLTGIMYLAPAATSGLNVCPNASPGCIASCLYTAGRGVMSNVQEARMRRTIFYHRFRPDFLRLLHLEVGQIMREADKLKMRPAIRLNGTSDIPWERHSYVNPTTGKRVASIIEAFPGVQFYDYTKRPPATRLAHKPDNYHLTFSRSETNAAYTREAMALGLNVAAVFRDVLPKTWEGREVINGDEHDLRFLDPSHVIVGLKAKGKARKEVTGFVIERA